MKMPGRDPGSFLLSAFHQQRVHVVEHPSSDFFSWISVALARKLLCSLDWQHTEVFTPLWGGGAKPPH